NQGGGIYTYSSHLQLTRSIIAFSKDGEGIFCYGDDSHQMVAICDIYGNEGGDQLCGVDTGGNFSEDPLFCDMAAGNLYLDEESPCLIGVDPYYFVIGANGLGDCSVAPVDDSDLARHSASGVLGQNHPNPFNPITIIPFELQKPGHSALRIFDLAGRHVINLLGGEMLGAGPHEVIWNGRDEAGNSVSSGVYFYRLDIQDFSETRRMVLMK
ncbi:MAG: T9SS type A sorting domain-containing protein, partial [Candidatus Krumholzibacteria bacterium]|nr:T9SS type A sorting domain-containing protein [Candidatus Krumholzibacteria bacterium]